MSVRKMKLPSGEVRWEVIVYEDGRGSKQLKRRFEKRVDADTWVLEFETKKSEKAKNPFMSVSFADRFFAEEADLWLTKSRGRSSIGHVSRAEKLKEDFLKEFGNLPIERMTPQFLTAFQQKRVDEGLTQASVNRQTEVLVAILNYAVKMKRIPFNPSNGFEKFKLVYSETAHWEVEEAQNFLAFIDARYPPLSQKRWVYLAYLIALNTGLRAGEVWGLKPSDLSTQTKLWVIRRQVCRITKELKPTKGKNIRAAPANDRVIRETQSWLAQKKIGSHDLIFTTKEGTPICHDNFMEWQFKRDLKAWGGRLIRFHDFRHTAATLMVADGVDIKTVQSICGHVDIQTTMRYSHTLNGAVQRVAGSFALAPHTVVEKEEVTSALEG